MTKKVNTETKTVQADHYCDPQTGSIVPAIYTSTTFARDKNYQLISEDYSYGRDENPTFTVPERVLADLEGGEEALLPRREARTRAARAHGTYSLVWVRRAR